MLLFPFLQDQSILGANFIQTKMTKTVFMNCKIENSNFSESIMEKTTFVNTGLEACDFIKTDLSNACFVATESEPPITKNLNFKKEKQKYDLLNNTCYSYYLRRYQNYKKWLFFGFCN